MKLIYQKHETGCVPAALASVANISYDRALKLLHGNRRHGKRKGTFHINLLRALNKLKIAYKITYKKFNKIKNPCVLFVTVKKPITQTEFGDYGNLIYPTSISHAIVWTGKKIFDPYSNRNDPDYKNFNAKRAKNRVFFTVEILS